MVVEIFHDRVSTDVEVRAGRGDRTRGRLHAKQTRFWSSYHARPVYNVTYNVTYSNMHRQSLNLPSQKDSYFHYI